MRNLTIKHSAFQKSSQGCSRNSLWRSTYDIFSL